VSPYRLTSHLTSAFVIYVLLFWTGLSLLDGRRVASASPVTAKRLSRLSALAHAATGPRPPALPRGAGRRSAARWQATSTQGARVRLISGRRAELRRVRRVCSDADATPPTCAGMAGVTVFSGGFVAGNHAGLAYNDWPYMGGRFVPSDVWDERLGWRNFTENIPTVQ